MRGCSSCSINWRHLSCFLLLGSQRRFLSTDNQSCSASDHNPQNSGVGHEEFCRRLPQSKQSTFHGPRAPASLLPGTEAGGHSVVTKLWVIWWPPRVTSIGVNHSNRDPLTTILPAAKPFTQPLCITCTNSPLLSHVPYCLSPRLSCPPLLPRMVNAVTQAQIPPPPPPTPTIAPATGSLLLASDLCCKIYHPLQTAVSDTMRPQLA